MNTSLKRILPGIVALALACGEHGEHYGRVADTGATVDSAGADVPAGADTVGTDSAAGGDTAGGTDTVVTGKACETAAECDDGLACTAETCTNGACAWTVTAGQCLIGAVCLTEGAPNPLEPCQVCRAESTTAWSARQGACDDGDPCSKDDVCDAGACTAGPAVTCDDGSPCTDDVCVPEVGCRSLARSGDCDDGDACTEGDLCVLGTCTGVPADCSDEDDCTLDSCGGGVCTHAPASDDTECSDGDACTSGEHCAGGACTGGDALTCDDGNACTIDYCTPGSGCGVLPTQSPCCTGTVSICDDEDSCTVDLCDPTTAECSHEKLSAGPCDDGEPCTGPDTCTSEGCEGPAVVCDDGSPCTTDACIPGQGCKVFPANEGQPCDDGLVCSTGDVCQSGSCAADLSECSCPVPVVDATKVATAQIGTVVKAGTALDLDGNPATCSPQGSCSDGVHNSFSVLAALANSALADAFTKGSIVLLFGAPAPYPATFDLLMYQGGLAPSNPSCSLATATCDYDVGASSFDDDCGARFSLPATVTGDKLVAGSPTSQIPFSIPFQGASLDVVVYAARLEATITTAGGQMTGFSGLLGGAVTKVALFTAVDGLPDDALPIPKDTVKAILETTIQYDIDTNNDGQGDAASIALAVTAIDGVITGVSE